MQHQSLCIFLNSKTANSYVNNYTSECLFRLPPLNIPKKSKLIYQFKLLQFHQVFIIVMILIISLTLL